MVVVPDKLNSRTYARSFLNLNAFRTEKPEGISSTLCNIGMEPVSVVME